MAFSSALYSQDMAPTCINTTEADTDECPARWFKGLWIPGCHVMGQLWWVLGGSRVGQAPYTCRLQLRLRVTFSRRIWMRILSN